MKLINWNNFGENFNYTLNNERRLQQQQAQFDQEMEYRNRQSGLDQDYRNSTLDISRGNLELDQQQQQRLGYESFAKNFAPTETLGVGRANPRTGNFDYGQSGENSVPITKESEIESNLGVDVAEGDYVNRALIPEIAEPFKTEGARVGKDGFVYRWDENTREYIKTDLQAPEKDYKYKTEENNGLTTPYTKQVELDRAWDYYNELQNLKEVEGGGYNYYDKDGKSGTATEEQIRVTKKRAYDEVKALTDDKAKWYNQHYANFDQAYRGFKSSLAAGEITLETLEMVINDEMGDAPADVKQAMIDLLGKRAPITYREKIL